MDSIKRHEIETHKFLSTVWNLDWLDILQVNITANMRSIFAVKVLLHYVVSHQKSRSLQKSWKKSLLKIKNTTVWQEKGWYKPKKLMVESVDSSSVMKQQGWLVWGSMNKCAHVRFSTVTLFSIFHKAVATLLAPHQVLHVGHVVETHAPSFLEIAVQVSFAASAENTWEWMPEKGYFHSILEEQSLQKIDSINYSFPALFCWYVTVVSCVSVWCFVGLWDSICRLSRQGNVFFYYVFGHALEVGERDNKTTSMKTGDKNSIIVIIE